MRIEKKKNLRKICCTNKTFFKNTIPHHFLHCYMQCKEVTSREKKIMKYKRGKKSLCYGEWKSIFTVLLELKKLILAIFYINTVLVLNNKRMTAFCWNENLAFTSVAKVNDAWILQLAASFFVRIENGSWNFSSFFKGKCLQLVFWKFM